MVVKSGGVKTIVFSADAAEEPLYSRLRVNGKLSVILENIEPMNLSNRKKDKKRIKKDNAFLTSSVSIYVSKIGKSKGP